jgi:predicted dehydrogenase
VAGSALLFQREVEDFVSAILDGTPPVVSLVESRKTAATLVALYRAAREDRTIISSA